MPGYYDENDCSVGWNGDLNLESGDVKQTLSDGLQSLLDQIHVVCASSANDWAIYPGKGANLEDFVGEPNTRIVGDRIRERVIISIVGAELVTEEDLNVRVIPVHIHKVLIIIRINALPTEFNQLEAGQVLQTAMVFDSLEKEVFFLDKVPLLTDY